MKRKRPALGLGPAESELIIASAADSVNENRPRRIAWAVRLSLHLVCRLHKYATTMQLLSTGVIGASGYAGIELTRILALHPHVELRLAASDRWQGESLDQHTGLSCGGLRYAPLDGSDSVARACSVVFLATPAEVSLKLAPPLLAAGVRVIDLSGAFRLRDAAVFRKHYGLEHSNPELLAEARYGLPELQTQQEDAELSKARLIANPGCYATAAALALWPLVAGDLVEPGSLIVDAASGTTGSGRKATFDLSFNEVDEDYRAYRVLRHQHTPEISQTLGGVALTFTAHLLPLKRGILATCYARLRKGRDAAAVTAAYAHKYALARFVRVLASPDDVNLRSVVGTNRCDLAVACDEGVVVAVAAIDNLVKGAAGQAVQNLNLAMGWAESAGLDTLRGVHP